MTSTTLQFSNDTVSAQLNNGSELQLCVYRVREDERFKCESFAVAVLPPNSSVFTKVVWHETSADDVSATLTIDFVFIPLTSECVKSFADVWSSANERDRHSATLQAHRALSDCEACAPATATFTFVNDKSANMKGVQKTPSPPPSSIAEQGTAQQDPPPICRQRVRNSAPPPTIKLEDLNDWMPKRAQPPITARQCDVRVDLKAYEIFNSPTKDELNKELREYGIKINKLCIGASPSNRPRGQQTSTSSAKPTPNMVRKPAPKVDPQPPIRHRPTSEGADATSPTSSTTAPMTSQSSLTISMQGDSSICETITRATTITLVLLMALLFYWSFHIIVHFSVQLPL